MKKQFKKIVVPGLKMRSGFLRCPQCGSPDVKPVNRTMMQCKNCGATFSAKNDRDVFS